MPRERYYEVPRGAWMFSAPETEGATRAQLEEPVRQWCVFELIRAYGYQVSDFTFEHPVRVGSKHHRIDILLRLSGKPFAVVECKERNHAKHAAAVDQAISYAGSREIGAEFAVYTNGNVWLVRRRVGESWVPVVDLPARDWTAGSGSVDELLRTIKAVSPVLHQLDEPLVDAEARAFMGALQEFFLGSNLLTESFHKDLRFATDVLLRVLSVGMDDEHYRLEKMGGFARLVESFRKLSGAGAPISDSLADIDSRMCFAELWAGLDALLRGEGRAVGPDVLLLRFQLALLGYGRELTFDFPKYPAVPAEIHHTLREVLSFGFATALAIKLPTALETKTSSDMKNFCFAAWNHYLTENKRQGA